MENLYHIVNKKNGEIWSNVHGWIHPATATEDEMFTEEERQTLNLPMGESTDEYSWELI